VSGVRSASRTACIKAVQKLSGALNGTKERLAVFNASNALVRRPIEPAEIATLGFDTEEDRFSLLQGDIVATEAAYFLGERIGGSPKYAVLNSSCDLVPNRSRFTVLLKISQIKASEAAAKEKLGTLLKFTRRDSMYLPVLPGDRAEEIANVVQFDGVCEIRTEDLLLVDRIASLSLAGWRIFGSLTRVVFARANPWVIFSRLLRERPVRQRSAWARSAPAQCPTRPPALPRTTRLIPRVPREAAITWSHDAAAECLPPARECPPPCSPARAIRSAVSGGRGTR